MSMERAEKIAIDAAKEITIAALEHGDRFPADNGTMTAVYFENVYNKVLEIVKQAQD